MKPVHSLLLCLLFTTLTICSFAQGDIFMRLEGGGVQGESTVTNYVGWTEVNSFNGGSTAAVSTGGGGGGAAPAVTKCFTVSILQDKASYHLKRKMYLGSPLINVQLDFLRQNGAGGAIVYYRLFMENVYVTAIEEAVTDDAGILMNISFTPQRFRYSYFFQNPNGSPAPPSIFGWDTFQNTTW